MAANLEAPYGPDATIREENGTSTTFELTEKKMQIFQDYWQLDCVIISQIYLYTDCSLYNTTTR